MKGFTLIELLVAMGIMAVLTGMATFNFNQSRVRARDVQRKNDMSQLQKALELYRNDNGDYPATDFQNTLMNPVAYTKFLFVDPRSGEWADYQYKVGVGGRTYYMMACLENAGDSTKATDTAVCGLFTTDLVDQCRCGKPGGTKSGVMYIVSQP